jgi:hypothetical protein
MLGLLRTFLKCSHHQLLAVVRRALGVLQAAGGCIALVYSLVLTRTVACIRGDVDEKDRRMMGAHSYCTQELVNLLTTGIATSNVFDGVKDLGGGMVLRGVQVPPPPPPPSPLPLP